MRMSEWSSDVCASYLWGLPTPGRHVEVLLGEWRRALLDFAWPDHRIGLEYDGARYHAPRRLAADVLREERLRAAGWHFLRADRHDLQPSSTRLRDELLPILRDAAA